MGQLYNNISYYLEPTDFITIFERILKYVLEISSSVSAERFLYFIYFIYFLF